MLVENIQDSENQIQSRQPNLFSKPKLTQNRLTQPSQRNSSNYNDVINRVHSNANQPVILSRSKQLLNIVDIQQSDQEGIDNVKNGKIGQKHVQLFEPSDQNICRFGQKTKIGIAKPLKQSSNETIDHTIKSNNKNLDAFQDEKQLGQVFNYASVQSNSAMSSLNQISTHTTAEKNKNKRKSAKAQPNQYKGITLNLYDLTENSSSAQLNRSGKVKISKSQITNIAQFAKKAIPHGKILQCTLKRNKSFCKKFYLDYDLETNDGKFLLSCKKMPFNICSTYNISYLNGSYEQKDGYLLSKVEGNFTGSVFNILTYDIDKNAQYVSATIYYSSDFCGCKQQCRQVQIYLKNQHYSFQQLQGAIQIRNSNLKELYDIGNNKQTKKISKFVTKKPKWDVKNEVYYLNFHGKSKYPSVKNMIIIDENKPSEQLLLIAKNGSNEFQLDICHPFSPSIALGLMISGFDFKLASQ